MRSSSSETRLRGAGDGTWHSLSCQPGFGDFSSVLRALGDRFARASIWPVFNYRAPQGPLSAVPRRDRCASGRRERASTTRPPLVAPLDARPRGVPPSPSYTEKQDGRDAPWLGVRTLTRTRRLRVLACNTHNAGAGPGHEARIRSVHRRAVRPVCVFCGGARVPAARRVERAIAAEAI